MKVEFWLPKGRITQAVLSAADTAYLFTTLSKYLRVIYNYILWLRHSNAHIKCVCSSNHFQEDS